MAKPPDARAPFTEPSGRRARTLDRMLGVALATCAYPGLPARDYAEELGESVAAVNYWLGCLFERACVVRHRAGLLRRVEDLRLDARVHRVDVVCRPGPDPGEGENAKRSRS